MMNQIDLARADLNLLVLFDVVLQTGHVGRAAERLSLTPSAVSHGLGRLRRLLNDPLFLRTPRGVVATAHALQLAAPIAEVLAGARSVIAAAEPFDPARSSRRFRIGAPDGAFAVMLPGLLRELAHRAPRIDIGVRELLPAAGIHSPEKAWNGALSELEARAIDLAVVPLDAIPARFTQRVLYEEDFVVAMRAGHPLSKALTLDRFCRAQHIVVSRSGDPYGFVDAALAEAGRSRRVALTVPSFMVALATVARSDLIGALPRRFVAMHGEALRVICRAAPLRLPRFKVRAVAPSVALTDAGTAWLFECLVSSIPPMPSRVRRS